jgi:ectoine hydroxylase-related dioxygenase (phytanoyl-CoA dioxygenase family)
MTSSALASVLERGALDAAATASLAGAATAIASWPAGSHVWGHYAEETASGPAICRTENVSACHPAVAVLVDGTLRTIAAERLGAPAAAFKDKINYKQPGGAGFRPHQDAVAYPGVPRVVSILVAIDECSRTSGCLWLAGGVDEVLPVDARGVVQADVCDALTWEAAELAPGDAVILDGFAPHYSDANASASQRRVLVASYTRADAGYDRTTYYTRRAETMNASTERDGRFRISTLADFAGEEVAAASPADDICTHPPA